MVSTLLTFAGAAIVCILAKLLLTRRDRFPPGPRRLPLIGSALHVPRTYPWLKFSEWAKTYGSIVYADVFGQPLIVLNSAKIARDLLDQRSAIYSERPTMIMGNLSGYGQPFILQPYGENWRQQRRIVAQDFSQIGIIRYHPIQEREARKFISGIIEDSSTLFRQLKLRMGTIIIQVTYGHYLKDENDPFLTMPLTAMDNFSKSTAPGAWLVDFIPQLQYMPVWMPGASFLSTAAKWRQIVWDTTWQPYLWSKKNLESGNILLPNMCSTFLEEADRNPSEEQQDRLVWAASTVMGAGMDTNVSTVLIFFLAMILNPAVQAKARKELDDIIGRDRLPTIDDKVSLPYIRSIMTEVLRWHPAVPLGVPHSVKRDDIYEGVLLPKGSLMIPNVWYMLHDSEVFANPDVFDPDRYHNLDSEMEKVTELVFGFGRRVCPGKLFAEGTFFAIVATLLSTCEISAPVDASGKTMIPEVTFSSGTIIFPSSFEVNVECRSEKARELLDSAVTE
ncbi:putative monooxygenase [Mycena belliarum]|uniref:Monooxygenase n=1 Tax=Mycena belliarum TaxID=1033014 RepID=A0AAD6TRK3_9AGAR|nr:putative monooxygenase [Mycena belliae]